MAPAGNRNGSLIFNHRSPRGDYRVLAPRSGPDGNELGCLPPPEVAVPVATYTSWQLRNEKAGAANQLRGLQGSYIPFPITRKARTATADPRRSLEERYGTLENYLEQLEEACLRYQKSGYLLENDISGIIDEQRKRVAPLFEKIVTKKIEVENAAVQ